MAKHRKTRKEKKLADSRHKFTYNLTTAPATPGEVKLTLKEDKSVRQVETKQAFTSINSYPYLVKDLSKTSLLTLSILVFQIILFLLIKNHSVVIPGLNY